MTKPRLLIITANRANRSLLEERLEGSCKIVTSTSDDVLDISFDLAILDARTLSDLKQQVQERREDEQPVFLPFLVCLPRDHANSAARFLGKLVDDIILTPIEPMELKARINNLLRMRAMSLDLQDKLEEVQELSVTDDVSGFHNTRFLHQCLDGLLARPGAVVSLVFTDMDRFKAVVDTHGHLLGAQVLREAAETFHRHLGPDDRIVRYGGDEYVIVLPGQGKDEARDKVERLRQGLADDTFLRKEKINLKITASIGLATYPDDASDKRELLAAADRCLFRSKAGGKNRVTVYKAESRDHEAAG